MKSNRNGDVEIVKEVDGMSTVVLDKRKNYKRLDFTKIKFADKSVSTEEALKNITPVEWTDDVLSGKKKVIVKGQK